MQGWIITEGVISDTVHAGRDVHTGQFVDVGEGITLNSLDAIPQDEFLEIGTIIETVIINQLDGEGNLSTNHLVDVCKDMILHLGHSIELAQISHLGRDARIHQVIAGDFTQLDVLVAVKHSEREAIDGERVATRQG